MAHTMRALKALISAAPGPIPYSPTATAKAQHEASREPDRGLALGSPHLRTRKAHNFCSGGCGVVGHPDSPYWDEHADHAEGCGTHNPGKCGGRRAANSFPLSLVAKNDHTLRIALGIKRAMRIKERGW